MIYIKIKIAIWAAIIAIIIILVTHILIINSTDNLSKFTNQLVLITGCVSDDNGIKLSKFSINNSVNISEDGCFSFETNRKNTALKISKDGYYSEIVPLYLQTDNNLANLTIILHKKIIQNLDFYLEGMYLLVGDI